jgi:uncharacterized membrane protein
MFKLGFLPYSSISLLFPFSILNYIVFFSVGYLLTLRYSGYTGYIDFGARHLFFYFFESRNDPSTDDIMFWTNGGPGGSSAMGLFMELGMSPFLARDSSSISWPIYL